MKKHTIIIILVLLFIYLAIVLYYNINKKDNIENTITEETSQEKVETNNTINQNYIFENMEESIFSKFDSTKIDEAIGRGQALNEYIEENPDLYPQKLVDELNKLNEQALFYTIDPDNIESEQKRIDKIADDLIEVADKLKVYIPKEEIIEDLVEADKEE